MSGSVGRAVVSALLVGLSLGLTACGTPSLPKEEVAKQISDRFAATGQSAQVTCPDKLPATVGASIKCTVKIADKTTAIKATVTKVENGKPSLNLVPDNPG